MTVAVNMVTFPYVSSFILGSMAQRLPDWFLRVVDLWGWGTTIFNIFVNIILWILSLLVLIILFKPITLALLSPIFTRLSQITEETLAIGLSPPPTPRHMIYSSIPSN